MWKATPLFLDMISLVMSGVALPLCHMIWSMVGQMIREPALVNMAGWLLTYKTFTVALWSFMEQTCLDTITLRLLLIPIPLNSAACMSRRRTQPARVGISLAHPLPLKLPLPTTMALVLVVSSSPSLQMSHVHLLAMTSLATSGTQPSLRPTP